MIGPMVRRQAFGTISHRDFPLFKLVELKLNSYVLGNTQMQSPSDGERVHFLLQPNRAVAHWLAGRVHA